VVVKGTTTGVITDNSGNYSIGIPENAVLVFSFVGMKTQEIAVGNKTTINVTLAEETIGIEEVVAIGYGTMKKKDLTSAISKVEGSTLHNQPIASAAAALVGKSTGVQVISNSGSPGSSVTVRIRGASSLSSGGNDPLYVVDGVPTGNILGINPNDIESIEVLKDASSAAIYGTRASNGVILISTKTGKKGHTEMSFDSFYGIQQVYKKMPMMNAQEQYEYIQKGITNYNRLNPTTPVLIRDQVKLDYQAGYDTNWQDEIFRVAPVQNYSFSASGGADKTTFSSNIGYYNQQGVVLSNGYQRVTGRFTLDYDLNNYLTIGTSFRGNYSVMDQIPTGDGATSIMGNLQRKMALEPIYEPDGSYALRERPNVVGIAKEYIGKDYETAGLGLMYAKLKILKDMEFKTTWSADFYNNIGDSFYPSNIPGGTTRPSSGYSNRGLTWLSENILSYSFQTGKLNLKSILGFSMQEFNSYSLNAAASGGPSNIISTMNASAVKDVTNSYKTGWGMNSVFARVNLNYSSKYLATLSIRRDGSSRFGTNNQYALFPAGSVAWRINEEGFLKDVKEINELKVRAGIGRTGNQNIGNYVAQGTYVTGANYNGQSGVMVGGIPSADLSWETTDQYDTGFDLAIFDRRINFSTDFYLKKTDGLLFSMPLPEYTGFGSYWTNLGKIENKGMEFSLDGDIIRGKELNWSAGFNISFNANKVLELPKGLPIITNQTTGAFYTTNAQFLTQEGHPIGEFYGLKWTGEVYATDEIAKAHVSKIMGLAPVGGTLKYEDFSGPAGVPDGVIDSYDRQMIGSPHPKFFGGFNTQLKWKNFDLDIQLSFVYGNKLFNQMRFLSSRGFAYDAARKERSNAWSEPGQITTEHKVVTNTDSRDNQFSSKYVEDASYLRLNNLTLGYNLPKSISQILKISDCRFYLSAQNLLTLTKYTGYDPEVNAKAGNIQTQGVDMGMVPQVSTFMAGVNLKF
jgi:TonB-linked SusC/RagA family outer membrane protein